MQIIAKYLIEKIKSLKIIVVSLKLEITLGLS